VAEDDPFADFGESDRTIVRPTPGGRVPQSQRNQTSQTAIDQTDLYKQQNWFVPGRENNILLTHAFPLLTLVNQLRNTAFHHDVESLHTHVVAEIRRFENAVMGAGVPQDQVRAARYALCSLIDETVLNTPWGSNSQWSHKSLLISFHKEAWGGEKVFQIINQLAREAEAKRDLLELLYYCLAMGFEGKYRIHEQGQAKLEKLRENLYLLLQRQRGDIEAQLSPRWEGIQDKRNKLIRHVPLWVVGAISGLLLMVVYLGFLFVINRDSNPVLKSIYAIGKETPPTIYTAPQVEVVVERSVLDELQTFLAPEVAQGLLEVLQTQEGTVVRIRGLFASGKDRLKKKFYPLIGRVAQALETVTGSIIIAGNTDSIPIFTARFPSNWALSQARADTVGEIIKSQASLHGRVMTEGRADNEPLADNNTAANRALNRRLDIIVK